MSKFKLVIAVFLLNASLFPHISLAEVSAEQLNQIVQNSKEKATEEISLKKEELRKAIAEFNQELDLARETMNQNKDDSNFYFKLSAASFAIFVLARTYIKYSGKSVSVIEQFLLTLTSGPVTIVGLGAKGGVDHYQFTIAKDKVEELERSINNLYEQLEIL